MISDKKDLVYIDCFYYGFYIKKCELGKFNIKHEQLVEDTQKIIKVNKKVNNKPKTKISDSLLENINAKFKISNFSNTLNSSKVLEQFNSCDFSIIYDLLTLKTVLKKYKNTS